MSNEFPFTLPEIQAAAGSAFAADSLVLHQGAAFWYEAQDAGGRLVVLAKPDDPALPRFHGARQDFREGYCLLSCPADWDNSRALRATLPWLQPTPLGLTTSAGFGDRLGLATPGHVQALRHVLGESPGKTLLPIFAQQSIREMERTQRTPQDVLNDATWGAFQAGWRKALGADADHLKTTLDIDACAAAGYSFYTIDPGAFVESAADAAPPARIQEQAEALPWSLLESSLADLARHYFDKTIDLETQRVPLEESAMLRAAVKYGRAVLHTASLYRHLASKNIPFELELSVDETETPTTPAEHIFIVSELTRLGVWWVSLAPRYVGRFEKGVDYIGDVQALRQDLQTHAEIARVLGPYKLSLHSGSDKFLVYPLISEAARGMVHLKTAGTSYVEALRVVASVNVALFRDILTFARERYPTDRASYHVSAEVERVADGTRAPDSALPDLLDEFNTRQVLHVTFGSVLARFGAPLRATLQTHQAAYNQTLDQHFYRHLKPFVEAE